MRKYNVRYDHVIHPIPEYKTSKQVIMCTNIISKYKIKRWSSSSRIMWKWCICGGLLSGLDRVVSLVGIVSSAGAMGSDGLGMSGWGGGRSPRCCRIWRKIVVCWSWWARMAAIFQNKALCVVVSIWNVCTMPRNSMAEMVMKASDVEGASGGTVGVVEWAV